MLLLKMWPKRSRSNCCPKWHSLKRCPKCQYLNCPPKWCCSQRFKNAFARNLSWNIAQNYITQNVTQNVVVENRIAKNVAQNVSQNVIIQMSLLKMPLFEMSPKSLIFGCEKKVEHFGIRNVPYLTLVLFFLLSSHFRPLSSSRLTSSSTTSTLASLLRRRDRLKGASTIDGVTTKFSPFLGARDRCCGTLFTADDATLVC